MSTIKWKGGNGSFSQASNWTGGVVPGVNDVANITAAGTYTVTATGVNINTVDVGSGVTFSAAPGTAVTTSAVNNSGTIDIGSGGSLFVRTLTNDGTLELDGTLSETFLYLAPAAGQTVTTVSGSGQIVLAKGDGSNEIYFESATGDSVNLDQPVSGSGTITSNIPTTVNLNAGAVISTDQLIGLTISKNIEINANGHSIEATNSGDIDIQGTVTNANILTYGAGSTIAIDGGVIINSMLDTQNLSDPNLRDDIETSTSATLEGINGGALTNDGLFTTGPGGTLNLAGTIDNQGTFDFENGSTLNLTSSVIINDFGKITLEGADQIKATSLETRLTINSTDTTATGGNNVIGNGNIILDNEATIDADGIKGEVSLQLNHILDPRNIGLTQAASFNGGTLEATNDGSLIVEPYQGMYNGQDAIVSWFYNNGTMAAMSGGQVDMLSNLVLQNLSNGTLTGGTYESQGAGSVLLFNQAVTTDAATIILSGAGSRIVTNDFKDPVVDIEKELTTIAAGGKLEIQGNRNYTTNNSISLAGADTSGDAGGLLSLVGGTFSSGTITGAAGSRLLGYGTITSAIVENGLISAEFGTLTLAGATTLDGTVAVIRNDAPAALVVTGDVTGTGVVNLTGNVSAEFGGNASGQTVTFSNTGNTLKIDSPSTFGGTVAGTAAGNAIDLASIAYKASYQAAETVTSAGITLQIVDSANANAVVASVNLSNDFSGVPATVESDGGLGTDIGFGGTPFGLQPKLVLGGTGRITTPITGLQTGDIVDLSAVAYKSSYQTIVTPGATSTTVEVVDSANADAFISSLDFVGSFTNDKFQISSDGASGTNVTEENALTSNVLYLQYKGFNYIENEVGDYDNTTDVPAMAATGATSVAVVPIYGIDVADSTIYSGNVTTETLADVGTALTEASAAGLTTLVRPTFNYLYPQLSPNYDPNSGNFDQSNQYYVPYYFDGTSNIPPGVTPATVPNGASTTNYRGAVDPADLNIAKFFGDPTQVGSYDNMIVSQAVEAQASGATLFSIGTELDSLADDPAFTPYWDSLIADVRAVYTGKLTFSANWATANQVTFWNKLDYVGLDAYVPLSNTVPTSPDQNPSLASLIAAWNTPSSVQVAYSNGTTVAQQFANEGLGNVSAIDAFNELAGQSISKQYMFTEFGFQNDTGAASDPTGGSATGATDPSLQAELYQSFFDAFGAAQQTAANNGQSNAFAGAFIWNWDPEPGTSNPSVDNFDAYSLNGATNEGVITSNFQNTAAPAVPGDPIIANVYTQVGADIAPLPSGKTPISGIVYPFGAAPYTVTGDPSDNDGLLTGDFDPNGTTLSVTAVEGSAGNVGVEIQGTYGTFEVGADGSYIYSVYDTRSSLQAREADIAKLDAAPLGTPPTDQISFTVADQLGETSTQTLTVAVYRHLTAVAQNVNVAPGATVTGTAGTSGTGALAGDSDPDGLTLSVDIANIADFDGPNASTDTLAGSYGTLTVNADGSYSYTANTTSQLGNPTSVLTDTFSLSVEAGSNGATDVNSNLSFVINPLPVAPMGTRIKLGANVVVANPSSAFQAGDSADLTSTAYKSSYEAVETVAAGSVSVKIVDTANSNATVATTAFNGSFSGILFDIASDGSSGLDINLVSDPLVKPTAGDVITTNVANEPYAAFLDHYDVNGNLIAQTFFNANGSINSSINPLAPSVVSESNTAAIAGYMGTPEAASGTAGTSGTGALANDKDPSGTPIAITAVQGGTVGTAFNTGYGELTLNADGSYVYYAGGSALSAAPTGAAPVDQISFTVTDALGDSASSTLDITDYRVPIAVAETATTQAGQTVTGTAGTGGTGALAGDTDIDGTGLKVTAIDGTGLARSNPVAGAYGTLTLNADGSYSYSANSAASLATAFAGSTGPLDDVFRIAVSGNAGPAVTTLNFTIANPVSTANVVLTAAQIAAETPAAIEQLAAQGDTGFTATDTKPLVGGIEAAALAAAGFTVSFPSGLAKFAAVSGQPYTTIESDYDINGNLTGQTYFDNDGTVYLADSVTMLPGGETVVDYTSGLALAGQAYFAYENDFSNSQYTGSVYDYTAASGQPYTTYSISVDPTGNTTSETFYGTIGLPYSSYTYDFAGGSFVGASYNFTNVTGQAYNAYTVSEDGGNHLASVSFTGLSGTPYSAYEYDYTGGIYAGAQFDFTSVAAGASYSSYETTYGPGNQFTGDKFFFTDLPGQSYTGEEEDFSSTGMLTRVFLSGVSGQSYSALEEDYAGGSYTGYKAYYTGISGQSYTGQEADVSAAGAITKVVYTGLTNTPYSSVEDDYSAGALSGSVYDYTDLPGQLFYAYQVHEDAHGNPLQEIVDNDDGSHTIAGYQSNQGFSSIANDTFTGGAGGDTFSFASAFGHDTITDFGSYLSGANHDTVSLATSDFSTFSAIMSAAQNVGSNVVITAPSGNTLTLDNVTTSQMLANPTDFTLHS